MKKELITKLDPKSPVSEAFRILRTNIQYMGKKENGESVLFTSTVQGEGKSWIAANTAITFAQTGKKVVLIDADMRRPRQNNIFGVDMYPGLSNYLSGMTGGGVEKNIDIKYCIQTTEVENLFVIPAGSIPPNPAELLNSEKTVDLVKKLKEIFDIIIIDSAPCLIVTDSAILSRHVDYTILVASQKSTKIEDIKEAKKQIENVGGRVVGVVLNKVKLSKKKYENHYYYSQHETHREEKEDDTPSFKIERILNKENEQENLNEIKSITEDIKVNNYSNTYNTYNNPNSYNNLYNSKKHNITSKEAIDPNAMYNIFNTNDTNSANMYKPNNNIYNKEDNN